VSGYLRRIFVGCLGVGVVLAAERVPPPARELESTVTAVVQADLPGGDEQGNAAPLTLAKATNEPESLRALVAVVKLQRRRGDYSAGLTAAWDGLTRAHQLADRHLEVDFPDFLIFLGVSPFQRPYFQPFS
jgi:hypothetical protein